MPGFNDILIDRNSDGFFDDACVRFVVTPPTSDGDVDFWGRLIDIAARIGLECQALPLPLFLVEDGPPPEDAAPRIVLASLADLDRLEIPFVGPIVQQDTTNSPVAGNPSSDLLDLFTAAGMLADLDGDQLPDATTLGIKLSESISVDLGVALANLAVRIGLETGGVSFPLVGDAPRTLRFRISEGPAVLLSEAGSWIAEGGEDSIAALFEEISRSWPCFGQPDTAGARYAVQRLGRALVGDVPGEPVQGAVRWELQWSAEPETTRLLRAIDRELMSRVLPESNVEIVAYACEPFGIRQRLARSIEERLRVRGVENSSVRVLSAFKVGLSWLQEVVLPALEGQDVSLLRVEYQRFEEPEGRKHLDLSIRWLQELFPGNEVAADALGLPLDAIAMVESERPDGPIYQAEAFDGAGISIGTWNCDLLSYAMPFLANAPGSEQVQVTTGGFIGRIDGESLRIPVETDLEVFWRFWQGEVLRRVVRQIREEGGFVADRQPFFGSLEAEVWLSSPNSSLGIREENDSAAEALHEDIYFNTLDTIEVLGLSSSGDRTSAPGAVAPIVRVQPGVTPHAVVRLRDAPQSWQAPPDLNVSALTLIDGELVATIEVDDAGGIDLDLARIATSSASSKDPGEGFAAILRANGEETAIRLMLPEVLDASTTEGDPPPMDQNIHGGAVSGWATRLAGIDTVSAWVEDYSYQGREIIGMALHTAAPGRIWSPAKLALLKPTALIVARHHANEISSTNAALQLAYLCGTDPGWMELLRSVNIVVLPYENADGADLHARLASIPGAETWKHHPARYNALGYEFGEAFHDARARYGEARARPSIWRRWLPDVIVDNHGVPSHEWVQPFAGFGSPPRFRVSYWVPQALIYGIVRHVEDPEYPEHAAAAYALRDAVSAVVRDTDLGDLNREIGASYRFWGQDREPQSFPGEFHDGMLWHISSGLADPKGRGFETRYPKTTVLSWVTEVNDETATGEHFERVARGHLIANQAMLELMVNAGAAPGRSALQTGERVTQRYMRNRPLRLA